MRKVFLLFVAAALAWMAPAKAQNSNDQNVVRCYTMEADEQLRTLNPEMGSLDDFERWLAPLVEKYKAEQTDGEGNRINAVTTIPIIFHIIHNGESVGTGDNISATYVNAQITQLNNDFRRVSGTSGFNTNPVGADTEVEFCAATVDPNGGTLATPGINRINRNSKGWTAPPYGTCNGGNFGDAYIENTIKPQSQWDPTKYLNIWVMNMTCGILGYAQFPSNSGLSGLNTNGGSANTDGVVILGSSVGSTTTPNPAGGAYNKGRTLTHEIGHWIGLRHIWGDGGCSVDDYCNDTPTSDAANFGCPNHTSCGSTDMVENYMDYTDDDCMNIFTQDQKARMMAVLANSPRRNTLGASNGCGSGGGGGNCATTITSFPYAESFESSFGAWTQGSGDDFDWSRNSGGTPSSNTGPTSAAQGSYYAYMEASSPNYPSKQTILNSPCFNLSSASQADFSFQYHMYGIAAMGSLTLQASTNNGSSWTTLWSRSGNQGNSWQSGTASLASYIGGSVQLRFIATTTSSWQGDIAVDDISLSTSGGTGGGCVNVDISITFDNYPEETSWEIRDGSTVVASGGTYGSQADGSTLNLTECLDEGCYDFVIYDTYGDGICCSYGNGSYLVTSGSTTLASGGSFGSSETTAFCVSGSSRDPQAEAALSQIEGLHLFPNPTAGRINYAYESATDAQAHLRIADMTGRVVMQMPVMINTGMNQQSIDVRELPAGTYMMSIQHQDALLSKRFVVVK